MLLAAPAPWLIPLSFSTSLWVLSSKIYMADLESALHYILRIEVGRFPVLEGQRLVALKKFVAVLAKVSRAVASLVCAIPQMVSVHSCKLGTPLAPPSRSPWSSWTPGPTALPVHHRCYPPASAIPHTSRTLPRTTLPHAAVWVGHRAHASHLGIFPADSATVALPA